MVFENCRFIDLSHVIDPSIPSWTGSCGFHAEIKMDYEQGLRVMAYKMHAGVGTHLDAPCHFFRDASSVADLPLDQLIVPICVIDVSHKRSANLLISVEDIAAYEKKYGEIPARSLVVGYTGWSEFWSDVSKYRNPDRNGEMHFPGFAAETAAFLLKCKVVGIGIDTLSPDGATVGPNEKFPVHKIILGAGLYILENLTNLQELPPSGAGVIVLPIKVKGGAEAAARVVGII
jgi:kynurenine formamidase